MEQFLLYRFLFIFFQNFKYTENGFPIENKKSILCKDGEIKISKIYEKTDFPVRTEIECLHKEKWFSVQFLNFEFWFIIIFSLFLIQKNFKKTVLKNENNFK